MSLVNTRNPFKRQARNVRRMKKALQRWGPEIQKANLQDLREYLLVKKERNKLVEVNQSMSEDQATIKRKSQMSGE